MYILGVDCAWTAKQPSGVALIRYEQNRSELVKFGRSYGEFCSDDVLWYEKAVGTAPDFTVLMEYCRQNGWDVDVVALDIPLAPQLITSRRSCDSAVSRYYGGKGAAVHSPNAERPGQIAVSIYKQLTDAGYVWNGNANSKAFIEVYPHASIIELLKLDYRLPYKVQNKKKYWRDATPEERNHNLISKLNLLKDAIVSHIDGVDKMMPDIDPNQKYKTSYLKGYEDVLDALICGITGIDYVKGNIRPFGDEEKIWVCD